MGNCLQDLISVSLTGWSSPSSHPLLSHLDVQEAKWQYGLCAMSFMQVKELMWKNSSGTPLPVMVFAVAGPASTSTL